MSPYTTRHSGQPGRKQKRTQVPSGSTDRQTSGSSATVPGVFCYLGQNATPPNTSSKMLSKSKRQVSVVCLSKMHTLYQSWGNTTQTQNEDYSTKLPALICKNVKVKKHKERTRNSSRLMEIKEIRPINRICGPRLGPRWRGNKTVWNLNINVA